MRPFSALLHRAGLVLVATAMIAAGCSSSDGDDSLATEASAPATATETDEQPDDAPIATDASETTAPEADETPATTEPPVEFVNYEVTVPAPPDADDAATLTGDPVEYPTTPISASQVVELGVEQDQWTLEEGVITSLQWLVQDIPFDSVPALGDVRSRSFSDLIDLAHEVLDDTSDADAADEIGSLLDRIFPPLDVLESIAVADDTSTEEPQGLMRLPRAAPAGDSCITVAVDAFEDLVAGDNCYAVKTFNSDPLAGYRLRVFYPLDWNGTPKEEVAQLTLDAMSNTTTTLDAFADIENSSLIFSLPRPDGSEGEDLGVATNATNECTITIFPTVQGSTTEAFKQLIAHETVHCVQFSDMGGSGGDWVDEGGAEYFSHWLYPEGGLESGFITDFDTGSRTTAVDSFSYEAWVWWQFLANQSSQQAVWEMQRRISNGGSIDAESNIEQLFHEFVILWSGPGFPNSANATVPGFEPSFSTRATITENGTVELPAEALVAARWRLDYDKERKFTQQRSGDGQAEVAMAEFAKRTNRGDWTELEEEIRSTCEDREPYALVATRVAGAHATAVDVEVEIAACDPCLLGTWRLDNASFDALIAHLATSQGAGELAGSFTTSGDYFLRFDDEQGWDSWRTNYAVTISAQGFEFVTRIASIEEGTYGTNREQTRLNVPTAVTIESRATSDLPFGGSVTVGEDSASVTMFGQTSSLPTPGGDEGPQSVAADYTCDEEVLTVTLDEGGPGAPPIRFDRVEDIPEPPTKLPPA